MRKKETIKANEFFNLSKTQQVKELRKMTKRANVRLSFLEEKDTITIAYRQSYQYNLEKDRDNNRFYEGSVYKTNEDIKQAFKAVTSFLDNKSSTMTGLQESVKNTIDEMVKNNNIDQKAISKMSAQEQRYASKYIAMASNKKLSDLEKNNITQYAYGLADTYNTAEGRPNNRFYRGIKFENDEELKKHLDNMIHFYNAKTSTPQGYNESIKTRLDAFREKGVQIPKDREYEFFQFLASNEFKKLGARVDSNQVVATFNEARKEGKDVEGINRLFREFLDTDLKFDQVQERLGTAKWLFKKKR
jgi:hypothetical protein